MERIYRDTVNEDIIVFNNIEDAHASSIQSAAWEIHSLICNEQNYVKNMEDLLELAEEIVKSCDKLKAACKGKKLDIYTLIK